MKQVGWKNPYEEKWKLIDNMKLIFNYVILHPF